MDQDSLNQLLERRIKLLQKLADSLQRGHAALCIPDYTQIPVQTKVQQDLCQELRRVSRLQASGSAGSAATSVKKCEKALVNELQDLQRRVAELNRSYAALLRRAQRTLNIFCRLLQNSGLTYVAPAVSALPRVQDRR
jgi:hypothetical protein